MVDEELQLIIQQSKRKKDEAQFSFLLSEWKKERKDASWASSMAMLPSYQKIMGMGPAVVPIILQQMESEGAEPDHWFWALHVISKADPVPEADRGNIAKMAAAWLEWGRTQG